MADRWTNFEVVYDLEDATAKNDAQFSTTSNISQGNVDDLVEDDITGSNFITLEQNHSVLDGSLTEYSSDRIVYYSSTMSDENGEFSTNPTITVNFSTLHSSYALTLYFLPEHPIEMRVTWKQFGIIQYSKIFEVNADKYVVNKDVPLYDELVIEFIKTLPNHNVKLNHLQFGVTLLWDENNIKNGTVVQERNRLSDKISINTLNFEVIDVTNDMNFGNSEGMYKYYQNAQSIKPYEIINGERISLGRFYLDKFSSDNNLGKMSAVSVIGLLDTIQFNEGSIYNGVRAGVLLEQIFGIAGIEDYEIDTDTYNQLLYGTLKPMSCRNALQAILFACNSIVDTLDPDTVKIKKSSKSIVGAITRDVKFSTKVTEAEYVTSVELEYTTLTASNDLTEALKGDYPAGTHTVIFTKPFRNLTINTGTLDEVSTYYAVFTIPQDSNVIISGYGYIEDTTKLSKQRELIDPGKRLLTKRFSTSLCSASRATELLNILLDYYTTNVITIDVKYLADDIQMDSLIQIENNRKEFNNYIGQYTKRTFDLTGGFIDNASLLGYFDISDTQIKAGNGELFADDNRII